MNGILAICTEGCKRQFIADEFQWAQLQLHKGVEKVFFTCTHCGKEYISHYTNPEIRNLQEKMRGLFNVQPIQRKQEREFQKLHKKIKKLMEKLKEKIETGETGG